MSTLNLFIFCSIEVELLQLEENIKNYELETQRWSARVNARWLGCLYNY